jgi:hypothetical protein
MSMFSIFAAFSYASTMNVVLGRRESQVLLETLGVIAATNAVLLWRWFNEKRPSFIEISTTRLYRVRTVLTPLCALLALIVWQNTTLQGFFAKRMLKTVSVKDPETLSKYEVRTLGDVARAAQRAGALTDSRDELAEVGSQLLSVKGDAEEAAFKAAENVAGYRSFLDGKIQAAPPPPTLSDWDNVFSQVIINPGAFGLLGPFRSSKDLVQLSDVTLDRNAFRNTVFLKSRIRYSGGPTLLNGVRFIDCTWIIDNTPAGRQLLAELVKSNSPSYTHEISQLNYR